MQIIIPASELAHRLLFQLHLPLVIRLPHPIHPPRIVAGQIVGDFSAMQKAARSCSARSITRAPSASPQRTSSTSSPPAPSTWTSCAWPPAPCPPPGFTPRPTSPMTPIKSLGGGAVIDGGGDVYPVIAVIQLRLAAGVVLVERDIEKTSGVFHARLCGVYLLPLREEKDGISAQTGSYLGDMVLPVRLSGSARTLLVS